MDEHMTDEYRARMDEAIKAQHREYAANEAAREGLLHMERRAEIVRNDLFPAYAWPGGYPIAYYSPGDGAVLCSDCAKNEFIMTGTRFRGEIEEEGSITCDDCNETFIEGEEDDESEPIGEEMFENSYIGGGGSPDWENM